MKMKKKEKKIARGVETTYNATKMAAKNLHYIFMLQGLSIIL